MVVLISLWSLFTLDLLEPVERGERRRERGERERESERERKIKERERREQ